MFVEIEECLENGEVQGCMARIFTKIIPPRAFYSLECQTHLGKPRGFFVYPPLFYWIFQRASNVL